MKQQDFTLTVVLDEHEDNDQDWTSLHQCLLMLFDSPLNQEGYLEVYIRLNSNDEKFIKLHREVRIPRTFKRFEQLFNNFLQGCDMPFVDTKDGQVKLLQFVNNKSFDHKFRIINLAPKLRNADFFTDTLNLHKRIVLFIEFGPVDYNILGNGREEEYEMKTFRRYNDAEDNVTYSISRYPLSPALTCVKLTTSFEKALDVF